MKNQLEIPFHLPMPRAGSIPREQRRRRAQWWFAQMRLVVDSAFDWRHVPPARPEQAYLMLRASR